MPCYAIAIREDNQHLLKDNGSYLFYTKKSLATDVCDSMNILRKGLKLEQVYSVCKVNEQDWKKVPTIYDQEYDNDYARRDVPVFTQCKTLHDGTDGIKRNTKSSKGNKKPSKGSTETLPF